MSTDDTPISPPLNPDTVTLPKSADVTPDAAAQAPHDPAILPTSSQPSGSDVPLAAESSSPEPSATEVPLGAEPTSTSAIAHSPVAPASITPVFPAPATVSSDLPGIAAQGLYRAFGPVRAVDGVTFTADQGKVTALIGPNGSGKTTLLLILAGLLSPDAGHAQILGHNIATQNLQARCLIGWMPDMFGTWDALTPLEILTTFGRAYGMKKADAEARAWDLLRQLWLIEFAKQPARVLSRGQKQRLGLARALVHNPQVLLLDEPASGLDPRSRIELRDIVRGLAEEGKTVLISSHVLSELEEFTDKAVFLSKGRTVDADTGSEITTRGWRLAAADAVSLRSFLTSVDIPWKDAPGTSGEVVITLTGFDSATQLIRTAVSAGVPLHTIAPLTGRLEEAYLTLNEDRR